MDATTVDLGPRRQARNSSLAEHVGFGLGRCTQGVVLVACTDIGVRAILLGDQADELRRKLRETLPDIAAIEDGLDVAGVLDRMLAAIDDRAADGAIRVDLGGTAIQRHVWRALWGIPVAETRTYAQIAAAVDRAAAYRAASGACVADVLAYAMAPNAAARVEPGSS